MNIIKDLLEPSDKTLSSATKKILSYTMSTEKENGKIVPKNKSIHIFKELTDED